MPSGNPQIYVCSNCSSSYFMFLIISKGTGALGELKIHVLQVSLLIIAILVVLLIPGGGRCLLGIPDSCVFSFCNCSMCCFQVPRGRVPLWELQFQIHVFPYLPR